MSESTSFRPPFVRMIASATAKKRLNWAPLVGYLSDAVIGMVEELFATREALGKLADNWRGRRKFRAGSASTRALDLLVDYPVVTLSRLADRLDVSAPQALAAINQLVEAGILVERTGYRRNRIYAAEEVLTVVNRPFGSGPPNEAIERKHGCEGASAN